MTVLVVEPGQTPEVREIDGSLESMQAIVGGCIELIYPWDEPVALVANDEGKLLGLPLNRGLCNNEGEIWDIVCGTFFLCGAPADSDELASLTAEQVEKYRRRFASPEIILSVNGHLVVVRDR